MFEGMRFAVTAVDGSFLDVADPYTDSLRFEGLTWDEAVELSRLAFVQGFEVILWAMEDSQADEQTESPI